ncbi:MAG: hypothetical protein NW207_07500 [Cytophagales bacterium]|nr:hypothetical protein [Cytophagales bacterium]
MLKLIFIVIVVGFVFSRIFRFLLKYFFYNEVLKKTGAYSHPSKSNPEGEININKQSSKNDIKDTSKGGEYIEYEVVK